MSSSSPQRSHGGGKSSSSSNSGDKNERPRSFDSKAKSRCWAKAEIVPGRHPERWRFDAAGNIVCKRLFNYMGCLCFEYDHIIPYSKGEAEGNVPQWIAKSSSAMETNGLFHRGCFPDDFLFGAGSSAYQYEGAANEGGRGPSVWDTFTQKFPGKIKDYSSGAVAVDSYRRYKEDVKIVKKIGLDAYRISISWPRILPTGKLSGGVNKEGIDFYNNLIDALIANGIEPFVTLFHWDLPQALEDEYGGFLSSQIVTDYHNYVELCFWEFGDRVKHWFTFNEPSNYSFNGYVTGGYPPGRGRSSSTQSVKSMDTIGQQEVCFDGDSSTEPYVVSHNILLAHADAVELYKQKYQISQKGKIGITLVSHWFKPLCKTSDSDRKAAERALDFMLGWFLHPLVFGDYPCSMRSSVGSRLPKFEEKEIKKLKGSFDFIGLNYYTANYATDLPKPDNETSSYTMDSRVELSTKRNNVPIGKPTPVDEFFGYPKGIYKLSKYIKDKYENPTIYITENGFGEENNAAKTILEAHNDEGRKDYLEQHLHCLRNAIENGEVNVKGYFVWSLLDCFEWTAGYTYRFGMVYVDYEHGLTRYPKDSAIWYMNFLNMNNQKISEKALTI